MSEVSKSNKKRSVLQNIYIMLVPITVICYCFLFGINLLLELDLEFLVGAVMVSAACMGLVFQYKNQLFGLRPDGTRRRGYPFMMFTYLGAWLIGCLLLPINKIWGYLPISSFLLNLIGVLLLTHLVYLIIYLKLRSGLK